MIRNHTQKRVFKMKRVVAYLMGLLLLITIGYIGFIKGDYPDWLTVHQLLLKCGLTGMLGGVLYCGRAVYLNKCVRKTWDPEWMVWYFLRPVISGICGVTAYVFLKAGLVVLDASQNSSGGTYGYLAFALFAGLNVDRFMAKIEELGVAMFGIEKSRAARSSDDDNQGHNK